MALAYNIIGFYAVWFTSVLSAANGVPWVGPIAALWFVAGHLSMSRTHGADAALVFIAAGLGYGLDSALVLTGLLGFPEPARFGGPSTLWMVGLWVAFAVTVLHALRWLIGRPIVAAVFGLVGGPIAYAAGSGLGAISLGERPPVTLAAVGIGYAIVVPALAELGSRLTRSFAAASDHATAANERERVVANAGGQPS